MIRVRRAICAVATFASACHVTRTASRYETLVAIIAGTVRVAFTLLKPRVHFLLIRHFSLLSSLFPPSAPFGVLTAVIRVRRAICAIGAFASARHVTRTSRRYETLIAVLALAVGVTFASLVARNQLPHGFGLAHRAPLLTPGPALGVLTAVVGVRSAICAVATFASARHMTRTARRHETFVAIVTLAAWRLNTTHIYRPTDDLIKSSLCSNYG